MRGVLVTSCWLALAGCAEIESAWQDDTSKEAKTTKTSPVVDHDLGLTRDDFQNMHAPALTEPTVSAHSSEPPIPDLAEVLAAPQPPKLGETKLVSIAVTDDVPLKDVFIELARMADVDIELDAGITGGVAFRAKDRPFNEVVERLTDLAGLRYKIQNSVLRIERDSAYIRDYPLNFLNLERASTGSFTLSSTGGSTATSASSGSSTVGTTAGSSASVNSKSDSDFWKQFEEGVKKILSYSEASRVSGATIAKQPGVPDSASGASGGASSGDNGQAFYILNRQASTLTVSGNSKQHEMVERFLKILESNVSSQVLIEAEILEVDLTDAYQTGIDWTRLGDNRVNFAGKFGTVTATKGGVPGTVAVLENNIGSGLSLNATMNFLEEFGTVRSISSPRLHAMNNQQAFLSFAQGLVYFNVKISTTDAVLGSNGQVVTAGTVNVTSTQLTAPIGVSLVLQPVIDDKNNEITMDIHPTLTSFVQYVPDPGFEISKADAISKLASSGADTSKFAGLSSQVPEIITREMDSIVKIKSGQALVIGGLIQNKVANDEAGVPGAAEFPLLGTLFQNIKRNTSKQELVIYLRATTVTPSNMPTVRDKVLYDKFMETPRPLNTSQ